MRTREQRASPLIVIAPHPSMPTKYKMCSRPKMDHARALFKQIVGTGAAPSALANVCLK